ncbi:hypothetical protein A6S26_03215 [Nostoc sp. ATCC 43529]|nr:hypothetical protein A6S26_03215 [Nostoc sp. ATCC 43529]
MLNQRLIAALLAVTAVTTTIVINVPSSYANVAVKFCKNNPHKCTKPLIRHGIPALQRYQNERSNRNQQVQQKLQQIRRQQLQQQYIQLPQTRTTP